MQQIIFIADCTVTLPPGVNPIAVTNISSKILLLAQHIAGTTVPIIRSSRLLYKWLLPVVFGALVFKLSVWCGAEGYMSGLEAGNQSTKYDRQQPLV